MRSATLTAVAAILSSAAPVGVAIGARAAAPEAAPLHPPRPPAVAAPGVGETLDVSPGSPLVDFSRHVPGTTRTLQEMTRAGTTRRMPPTLWRFTFVDSGARPLLIARPQPENGAASDGMRPAFVLDRRTLALLQVQDQSTGAPSLRVDGRTVRGEVRGPQGTRPIDATLSADAYFGPLADLVVESLPLRLGTTYRVPLWELPSASVATHLYTVARREDVTVLGRQWRGAWVVEDHDAETKADRGTLWLVDGPPYVVRWVINLPDGGAVRLDQEAVARD